MTLLMMPKLLLLKRLLPAAGLVVLLITEFVTGLWRNEEELYDLCIV